MRPQYSVYKLLTVVGGLVLYRDLSKVNTKPVIFHFVTCLNICPSRHSYELFKHL